MKRYIFLILSIICFFTAEQSMAMSCYASGDSVSDTVALKKIVVLPGASVNEIVWRSPVYTRNITCSSKVTENVYIYPYPQRTTQNLPAGVKMGLIVDGIDLGTSGARKNTNWSLDKETATKSFTIQSYMVKTGDIDTTGVTEISLFQFDGYGGLNRNPNSNYNFIVTNWGSVGTANCIPTIVNGGVNSIFVTDEVINSSNAISRPLTPSLKISITCDSSSPDVVNSISSVSGKLSVKGTQLAGYPDYFSTNKAGLGFKLKSGEKEYKPNEIYDFDIPLNNGKGNKTLSMDLTLGFPGKANLSYNSPTWIFSPKDSENIISSTTATFSPTNLIVD